MTGNKNNKVIIKKQKLRNNEYYSMQEEFDSLYKQSSEGKIFKNLYEIIIKEENILLAYRNIKNNKGSKTKGCDGRNIEYLKTLNSKELVKRIQEKFNNYIPKGVKRVNIPKPNGKTRPLGIPCIEDRIIQQAIKQVMEPICESKFHKHSYGFRPNRSTENAIARCTYLINRCQMKYVVDIDIKSFFDNVDHSKLKKQIWNIGIRDKRLISIIGKMLKAPIIDKDNKYIPTKGTPQGGILSPLLSNIVLNELDWWISNQWETFSTRHNYARDRSHEGKGIDYSNKYTSLRRTTKLKEIWLVRYADDFKIFCKDYKTAQKIYNATKLWLKERLNLDISSEKSKITNLNKNYTEFLGFKFKALPRKNRYICKSRMSDKAKEKVIRQIKEQIKTIQSKTNATEADRLNKIIIGCHNYYRIATLVSHDFKNIDFLLRKSFEIRLNRYMSNVDRKSEIYKKRYGGYNVKLKTVCGITIFPIFACKMKIPRSFNNNICNYTKQGRELIHKSLTGRTELIDEILETENKFNTEGLDNSISKLVGQNYKCYVTNQSLNSNDMIIFNVKTKRTLKSSKSNNYKNIVWIKKEIHELIIKIINKEKDLKGISKLTKKEISKLYELVKLPEEVYR